MIDQPQLSLVLSLKNWPIHPPQSYHLRLSPFSKKVMHHSGIAPSEIIPIHFEEFATTQKLSQQPYEVIVQKYHQFEQRRRRKIALLLQTMRNQLMQQQRQQIKQISSKRTNKLKQTKSIKLTSYKSNSKSHEKGKKTPSNLKPTKQKKSGRKIREKNKPQNSPSNYEVNIHMHGRQKIVLSPKGKSNILIRNYGHRNPKPPEQDNLRSNKGMNIKSRKIYEEELRISQEIQRYLEEWNFLEKKHQQELKEQELKQKQLRRLRKIHYIEKQQLGHKMHKIRDKITNLTDSFTHNQLFKSL